MISLDMLINSKSKIVNFCNIFLTPDLEYNLFLISQIIKARFDFRQKKENYNLR